MIVARMLNSTATVNNFIEIGSLEFIAGEQITVYMRLYDTDLDLRYIPPATNITTVTLNKSDGTTFSKIAIHEFDDRSMIYFTLSEIETEDLLGGNLSLSLDLAGDGSNIRKGVAQNVLSRSILTCS